MLGSQFSVKIISTSFPYRTFVKYCKSRYVLCFLIIGTFLVYVYIIMLLVSIEYTLICGTLLGLSLSTCA